MTERTPREQKLWDEQAAGRRAIRTPLLDDYWSAAISQARQAYVETSMMVSYAIPHGTDDSVLYLTVEGVQVFDMRLTFEEVNPWCIYDQVYSADRNQMVPRARWANQPVLPELMLAYIALLSDTSKGNK